jgi:hypothetical protein
MAFVLHRYLAFTFDVTCIVRAENLHNNGADIQTIRLTMKALRLSGVLRML